MKCKTCQGTGNNPITIQLEGKKCDNIYPEDYKCVYPNCTDCNGTGNIYTEQVGDEIKVITDYDKKESKIKGNLIGITRIKILSIDRKTGKCKVVML